MFEPRVWAQVPFHFWSGVFFVFGSMVGSFLNVCIHRMPRDESVVWPRSHCPHCNYSIPPYLNIPLLTWLWLRGKCRNCGASISPRYFAVELLTAVTFMTCWIQFGRQSPLLALAYCLLLAGFIAATFIDFEHLIIPDEITLGGIAVGFLCSAAVPALHRTANRAEALEQSFYGILAGGGIIYAILRLGKILFGRQRLAFEEETKFTFTETSLKYADQEIPYEEIFYRKSDTIVIEAKTVELADRCYFKTEVRLSPVKLQIGEETFAPEDVPHMEIISKEIVLPREAMGLGDVKFMAAIGAFLGWRGVVFTLMASAMVGSLVGISTILIGKREWSSRIPYGPYIAMAAVIYVFMPLSYQNSWKYHLDTLAKLMRGQNPF